MFQAIYQRSTGVEHRLICVMFVCTVLKKMSGNSVAVHQKKPPKTGLSVIGIKSSGLPVTTSIPVFPFSPVIFTFFIPCGVTKCFFFLGNLNAVYRNGIAVTGLRLWYTSRAMTSDITRNTV